MSSVTDLLKSFPIDLGQGSLRNTTQGKRIALALVPDGRGRRALDIGCGEGTQSGWLTSKGYTVDSVDIEKKYVDCQVVDANRGLPFPNEAFDLVWCSEVIEHLQNPRDVVPELERVLKPGGKLVLTTPNSSFWLYWVARLFGKSPADLQNPTHVHFFDERDIRMLFPTARVYGFFPYAIVKHRIERLIGPLSPTFVVEYTKAGK